eukprot:1616666-Pleurochrysis_carterae.AAC.1
MDCVWKAEKEGVPETAATGSGRKRDPRAKASRWMRCRAWRAKPPKTSKNDEGGDHVPAPQRVLVLCLLERGGPAYDGGKQALRLSVRESEGGSKGREGGAISGEGADDLELEELMVLRGRGVVHDT